MAELSSVDELNEELTVQRVVLESLQDKYWEGIDKERDGIAQEIQRLQGRLAQLKRHGHNASDDDARAFGSPSQTVSGPSAPHPRSRNSTPTVLGGRSFDMTRQSSQDVWDSPTSLPTRKRGLAIAEWDTSDGQSRAKRTTPSPSERPTAEGPRQTNTLKNHEPLDVIDLTGEEDYDASCIAENIQQQQCQKQLYQDSSMPSTVSSQRLPAPSSSFAMATGSQPNAFSKLMAPGGSSSRGPTDWSWDAISMPRNSISQTPIKSIEETRFPMPGAYDPNWDSSNQWRSSTSTPLPPANYSHGTVGRHSLGANMHSFIEPFSSPSGRRLKYSPAFHHSNGFGRSSPAMNGFNSASKLPRPGDALWQVIARTSEYLDSDSQSDQFGNTPPYRYTQFIDGGQESRMTGKELDDLLKNIRPDLDTPKENQEAGPPGLKFPLYRHQSIALTWMKQMEEGTNKGGILADDMGLGKTVSTLALMLARRGESRNKTNLIVGPLSLVRQWEDEIKTKTTFEGEMSIFVYHNRKSTADELLKHDVVITTYGTLAAELKRRQKFYEDNNDRNIDFNDKETAAKFPLLHPNKAKFYRVILDEAQCIKNRHTQTAKAAHQLKATYRWCLTGTPMMNGIKELYSLIRFLDIKPYNKWEEFRQAFGMLFGQKGDPKSVAMSRIQALLKAVMLRRKKDSKLDGKPILELPEKTEQVVYADLSIDERDFYKQLEEKAQVQFSKYLRDGSIGKNYSGILVLLLRLRQACCHPHLNLDLDDAGAPQTDEDVEKLVKALDHTIIERILSKEAFECPICYDAVPSPSFFIPCGHDSCKDCLTRITDNAVAQNICEGNESGQAKCPVCRVAFNPRKCFSYELFKKVHMPEKNEYLKKAPLADDVSSVNSDSDPDYLFEDEVDNKGNLKDFIIDDEDDEDLVTLEDLKSEASKKEALIKDEQQSQKMTRAKKKKKKKKIEKGKSRDKKFDVKPSMLKTLRQEAAKNSDAYKKYMGYLRKTWMPAAKVTECMALLGQIQESGEKTIVFSQWTLLLDLLQVAMHHEGFAHEPLRYDGSMTGDQRSCAATKFRDDKKSTVMLVSLRAGNAGLNLTVASRVIIMDPFWNPYIEMQAVDRTYRIGQQKNVQVYRILTRDTVEDRIVQLQEKKKEIVEAALDENESMKIGRLGVEELKFLFNTY